MNGDVLRRCERVIKCRDELAGVSVESISSGMLVLSLTPRAETAYKYQLSVQFDATTTALSSLELSPPDVPVDDLLYVAENVRSIHTLLAELHNRLHGYLRLKAEIARLAQRYAKPRSCAGGCTADADLVVMTITFSFQIEKLGEREIMVTFSTGTKWYAVPSWKGCDVRIDH